MDESRRQRALALGLLILRLGIGGYMLTHGWGKLQMLLAGNFEQMGDPIGLGPVASLVLVTFAELVCALLVTIGLATRPAAAVIAFSMAVAAFVAHAADPWTMQRAFEIFFAGESEFPVSKQPALMYLIVFLSLVFTGAGEWSLDALWARRRRR
jgi:putative oxidoreductase